VVDVTREPNGSFRVPIKLAFDDLSYVVEHSHSNRLMNKVFHSNEAAVPKSRTAIVKGASGYAMPGQALYIMGSSGAGKTSLLNLISDRIKKTNENLITGKVTLNDSTEMTQEVFGKVGAYVMQDDVLFVHFTPREALRFAARLKLRGDYDEQEDRVSRLLKELGLLHVADVIIGSNKNKTISGGERKRTAIGVELITDPSLLLLDEPTSGLDSFKALSIVKLLNRQARKGRTIISTIHQPSSEAFLHFD
jgi:ATP-binding cassette, subfamily G (WHITE), eye pigment precursor transporter